MAVTHTLPPKGKAKGGEEIIIRYGDGIFVLSDSFSIKPHYAHMPTKWKNIKQNKYYKYE